jgi:hypothetical protein
VHVGEHGQGLLLALALEHDYVTTEQEIAPRVHDLPVDFPHFFRRQGVARHLERIDLRATTELAEVQEGVDVGVSTDVGRVGADDPLPRDLLDLPEQGALGLRVQVRFRLLDRKERVDGVGAALAQLPAHVRPEH